MTLLQGALTSALGIRPWVVGGAGPALPGAPTVIDMHIDTGDYQWVVDWTAPADDGGSPILYYMVRFYDEADESLLHTYQTPDASKTDYNGYDDDEWYGITLGETHRVEVSAVTANGEGEPGTWTQLAATIPGVAYNIYPTTTTYASSDTPTVTWTLPGSDGGSAITKIVVRVIDAPTGETVYFTSADLAANAVSYNMPAGNLPANTGIRFQVQVFNAIGNSGGWSNPYTYESSAATRQSLNNFTGYTNSGHTVSATKEYLPDHPVHNLFDGANTASGDTVWYSAQGNPYQWTYDFGSTRRIKQYKIAAYYSTTNNPGGWQFQVSNDGTNWTTLDNQSGVNYTSNQEVKTFTLPWPVVGRYFRWDSMISEAGAGASIGAGEAELWGWAS